MRGHSRLVSATTREMSTREFTRALPLAAPVRGRCQNDAELLGLSVRTIRRRIASGQLPAYRSGRKVIRIKTSDLDRIFRRIPSAKS